MAMTMNGEVQLSAPPETVWEKLNDAATLKACIPGCEQLDKSSDTEFQAVATVKIGPVKAKFKGKVTLSDLDPPHGYKISGQGDGGVAGFALGDCEPVVGRQRLAAGAKAAGGVVDPAKAVWVEKIGRAGRHV